MDQENQDDIDRRTLIAQLLLLRFAAGLAAMAISDLVALRNDLVQMLTTPGALATSHRLEIAGLLDSVNASVSRSYKKSLESVNFAGVVDKVAKETAADLAAVTGIDAATMSPARAAEILSSTLIQGATVQEWWNRQAADAAFRAASIVRAGVANGSDMATIAKQVETEITALSARNMESLTRSAVLALANATREAVYEANPDTVLGKMQISVLDSQTTPTCRRYANAKWDLEDNPIGEKKLPYNGGPPRHWGCRSFIVPLLVADAKGMTTADLGAWIETMPMDQADSVFGSGRVAKWKKDAITTQQLLTGAGALK